MRLRLEIVTHAARGLLGKITEELLGCWGTTPVTRSEGQRLSALAG